MEVPRDSLIRNRRFHLLPPSVIFLLRKPVDKVQPQLLIFFHF